MRGRLIVSLLVALLLAACSQPAPDLSIPQLPDAAPFQPEAGSAIDSLLAAYDSGVRSLLSDQGFDVAQPSIVATGRDLAGVASFYDAELRARGWEPVPSSDPPTAGRALLSYRKSNTLLIVTAFDTTRFLGSGVVVYTIAASR